MKKPIYIAAVFGLMLGSFILGSRIGVEAFWQSDAKFKAALASMYLEKIEKRKIEDLKSSLDSDLDLALYLHGKSQSNFFIYLFPEMNIKDYEIVVEKSIVRAATYRKNHPTNHGELASLVSSPDEEKMQLQEFYQEVERVTKQYAK